MNRYLKENIIFATVVLAVLAGAVMLAVTVSNTTYDKFKVHCDAARGTVVWDGRQFQCLKK